MGYFQGYESANEYILNLDSMLAERRMDEACGSGWFGSKKTGCQRAKPQMQQQAARQPQRNTPKVAQKMQPGQQQKPKKEGLLKRGAKFVQKKAKGGRLADLDHIAPKNKTPRETPKTLAFMPTADQNMLSGVGRTGKEATLDQAKIASRFQELKKKGFSGDDQTRIVKEDFRIRQEMGVNTGAEIKRLEKFMADKDATNKFGTRTFINSAEEKYLDKNPDMIPLLEKRGLDKDMAINYVKDYRRINQVASSGTSSKYASELQKLNDHYFK